MCMLCPEFVDSCLECGWTDHTDRRYPKLFYVNGESFCEHLTVKYGTDDPSHYKHYRLYHTGPDCECIEQGWFTGRPEPLIPEDENDQRAAPE